MIIKELFKNFSGTSEVQIQYDECNYIFKNYDQAILNFGYYRIKNWYVRDNVLYISIQVDENVSESEF